MGNFVSQTGPCNFLFLRIGPWGNLFILLLYFFSPWRLLLFFLHWRQPHPHASFFLPPSVRHQARAGAVDRGAAVGVRALGLGWRPAQAAAGPAAAGGRGSAGARASARGAGERRPGQARGRAQE
jgi:hypothetical protein